MRSKFKPGDIVYKLGYDKNGKVVAVECVILDRIIIEEPIESYYTVKLTENSMKIGNTFSKLHPDRIYHTCFSDRLFSNINACENSKI